jgi:hypothetical protein
VWINQSDAPNLKAANSHGVCFALTTQWLESYTGDVSERMKFANSFRLFDSNGNIFRYYIPDEYITKQEQYRCIYESRQKRLLELKRKFYDYKKKNPGEISAPFEDAMIETFALHVKFFHSSACLDYKKIDGNLAFPGETEFKNAFSGFEANHSFYLVSLRKDPIYKELGESSNGHIVGFEFCPNYETGPYSHYFDANLGLFYFRVNLNNVFNFFYQKVLNLYNQKDYSIVEIRKFGTGSSGSSALVHKASRDELAS